MTLVSVTLPSDGDAGAAATVNNPINKIIAVINGNIDATNLAADAVTTSKIADEAITPAKMDPASKFVFSAVDGIASNATVTPDSTKDMYIVTALATGTTVAAPSGSPVDGQVLLLRVLDNGTPRTIAWNATYRVIGATLPTTTVANKTIYVGLKYNDADTKWDVLAVAEEE